MSLEISITFKFRNIAHYRLVKKYKLRNKLLSKFRNPYRQFRSRNMYEFIGGFYNLRLTSIVDMESNIKQYPAST